jgi:hypothetical protein
MSSIHSMMWSLALAALSPAATDPASEAPAEEVCASPAPDCCRELDTCHVSPAGDDGGHGTAESPWRTLQHAVDTIEPGDTIVVKPGRYAGFRIREGGTEADYKTIMAECPAIDPACADMLSVVDSVGPESRHDSLVEVERDVAADPSGDVVGCWVLDGLMISGSPRYGIDLRFTESIVVKNNVIEDSARTGIFFAHSDGTWVENNESRHNGEHGLYCSDSSHFPTIRMNYLHHNHAAGVHMNGGFGFGEGDGIIRSPVVERNRIAYNGHGGGAAINCDGVKDGIIRNNVAYQNSATGIALYRVDGAIASSDNKIYNNVFVMANPSRWVVAILGSEDGGGGTNNSIKNNILYTDDPTKGSIATYSTSKDVLDSDYNIVVDRFDTNVSLEGAAHATLAHWRSGRMPQDRHSLLAPADLDTLFVDRALDDYHVRSTSVARDAGVTIAEVVNDFDGQPRSAPYDIGADELAASLIPIAIGLRARPSRTALSDVPPRPDRGAAVDYGAGAHESGAAQVN